MFIQNLSTSGQPTIQIFLKILIIYFKMTLYCNSFDGLRRHSAGSWGIEGACILWIIYFFVNILTLWQIEMIFSNFKIEIEKITNKFLDKLEIENRNIFQRRRTSRFRLPEGVIFFVHVIFVAKIRWTFEKLHGDFCFKLPCLEAKTNFFVNQTHWHIKTTFTYR